MLHGQMRWQPKYLSVIQATAQRQVISLIPDS